MGFFSWNCKICGHPMLSSYAVNETGVDNSWMTDVVVIDEDGSILRGEYDGYGRVDDREIGAYAPQCYHRTCWELASRPIDYTEGSTSARDQGYFFDDGAHDVPEPKTFKEALRARPASPVKHSILG